MIVVLILLSTLSFLAGTGLLITMIVNVFLKKKISFKKLALGWTICSVVFLSSCVGSIVHSSDSKETASSEHTEQPKKIEQPKQPALTPAELEAKKEAAEKAKAEKARQEAIKKAQEAKIAAEKAKQDAIKKQQAAIKKAHQEYDDWVQGLFSPWDGSIREVNNLIKENMNDPESFKHVETRYSDLGFEKGIRFLVTFRGTNAFGGVLTNQFTGTIDYKTKMIHGNMVQ